MDTNSANLLAEIERYIAVSEMAETTFGRKAVNDGKFVQRLREGGRCWPETTEKTLAFIRNNPPLRRANSNLEGAQ